MTVAFWFVVQITSSVILTVSRTHGRYYNDAALCARGPSTTDCSSQFSEGEVTTCTVHNTHACENASDWTFHNPPEVLIDPSHAGFAIHVESYPWNDLHFSSFVTPAYNLTLVSLRQDITGFLLLLSQVGDPTYNSCRIFDFSKADRQKSKTISLYYDCFSNLNEVHMYHYNLLVRSLPQNEELQYLTSVPKAKHIEPLSVDMWESTLLIYVPSLSRGRVDMKFQPAPRYLKVEKYKVSVVRMDTKTHFAISEVFEDGSKQMLEASFDSVPSGTYTVAVEAVHNYCYNRCIGAESLTFTVLRQDNNHTWLVVILGLLVSLMIIGLGIWLLYFITAKFKRASVHSKTSPRALIVYSFDCPCHMNLVECFSECLSHCGNIQVILDKNHLLNQNYSIWLCDMISSCDFVIVVISPGTCAKASKLGHQKMQSATEDVSDLSHLIEGLTWGDLFSPALNMVLHFLASKKLSYDRVVIVYFEYYKPKKVLPVLNIGHDFHLMSDFNLLLHHLHGVRQSWLNRNIFFHQKICSVSKENSDRPCLHGLYQAISLMSMCSHGVQDTSDP